MPVTAGNGWKQANSATNLHAAHKWQIRADLLNLPCANSDKIPAQI